MGTRRVVDNILARGAGGMADPGSCPQSTIMLTSPSLARWWSLLNEMYDMMWRPMWMLCS